MKSIVTQQADRNAVVVNDDQTQLNILAKLLGRAGIRVGTYLRAEDALSAMDPARPPDLIVTDLYMPGIDGWQFCRLLRSPEYAAFNDVPILVVSATFAGEHPERIAADIGADDFLASPVDGREFLAHARALLKGREEHRRPRVLIVEDGKTLAAILKKTFTSYGYRADTAFSVSEAAEFFAQKAYDVAILDYHLPDGMGDTLLDAFKASRPDCVYLLMSTDPMPEQALSWMKRGAGAYLRKPFEPELLIELCARARRERALLRVEDLLERRTRELRENEAAVRNKLKAILEPEGDLDVMELADIIDIPAVKSLMESFHRITGMASAIVDNNGNVLVRVGWQDICTKFHRCHPETLKNCIESDTVLANGAEPGTFKSYRCKNGIWDMASPIEVSGRHMGAIHFGQFIYDDEEPDTKRFKNQAVIYGFNEEEYLAALSRVPRYSRQTARDVMAFYTKLSRMISSLSFNTVSLARTLTERDRAEETLRLQSLVLDQIEDRVTITDLDGIINYVNDSQVQGLGRPREKLIGSSTEIYGQDGERGATQRQILETTLHDGQWRGEVVNFAADGREIIMDCRTQVIYDPQGQPVALCGIATDITQRKILEESLRLSEKKFQLFFEMAPDPYYINDLNGTFIDGNLAAQTLIGYQKEELVGRNFADANILHPDHFSTAISILEKNRKGESTGPDEFTLVRKDGKEVIVEINNNPFKVNDKNIVLGIARDITDRKKLERFLEESEKRFRFIAENTADGILVIENEKIVYASPSYFNILGYPESREIGRTTADIIELIHPDDRGRVLEKINKSIEELQPDITYSYRAKAVNGAYVWREDHARFKYGSGGEYEKAIVVCQDINERMQFEGALRESERRLNLALKVAKMGYWQFNCITKEVEWSSGHDSLFGIPMEDFGGTLDAVQKCIHPEDREHGIKNLQKALEEDVPFDNTYRVVHPNGDIRWLHSYGHVFRDRHGKPKTIFGITQDITEQKCLEADRIEQQSFLEAIFSNTPVILMVLDGERRIKKVNDFATQFTGSPSSQMEGMRLGEALKCSHALESNEGCGSSIPCRQCVARNSVIDTYNNGTTHIQVEASYPIEQEGAAKDVTFLVSTKPITIKESQMVLLTMMDVSDRRRAEIEKADLRLQLQQAQKMEAIGTLAGGVAHDFNNLLQAINGYTQLLLMDKSEYDQEYHSLKAIQDAGFRASDLVRQLLLFSRKAESTKRPIELQQEVEKAKKMLERTIPKMIEIQILTGNRLWAITADPVQIEQMLLNLGTNAADAMPEGGMLIFEIQNTTLHDDYMNRHLGTPPGNYVLLTVSDTGHGIDKETSEKIYEPFFTTKEFGKGTGLGLASVYGIVKDHGGYITCYSEVGQGATFKIYFPARVQPEIEESKKVEVKPIPGGSETILIVDDEKPIRDFAEQALAKFGYTVRTASNGEEALELYSSKSNEIDLVVMDLGMPGMGGHKCLQELLQIEPLVKVVIASGYSLEGQARKSIEAGAKGYVGKPYQLADMLNTVRKVLDETN